MRKHLAIFAEHYRQPISKLSVLAYAEDLRGLSPDELDAACVHARKTSEFMPVSAAILKAHKELAAERADEYLGPPMIEYPPVTQEERDAALEFSAALRKQLTAIPVPQQKKEKKLTIVPSRLSLDEQKAELRRRGLLK